MSALSPPLVEFAPAKINLTLRVTGRRPDGYHDIESLMVFADFGDELLLVPGEALELTIKGPAAGPLTAETDNLVLKAACALARGIDGLTLGRFTLNKHIPVAAGLGGGSADAAAALRLLARANGIVLGDRRLMDIAPAIGADVPACLDPRPRLVRGIGEILSDPLDLPKLAAVLVNPGVALPTKDVFAKLDTTHRDETRNEAATGKLDPPFSFLSTQRNDLEPAAIALQPVIAEVLEMLRGVPHCRLARMSGSGATCFGLFDSDETAHSAAAQIAAVRPRWWVKPCVLG